MSRFAEIFSRTKRERRSALVPFITAGDPSLEGSLAIALELARVGADVLELGVPFSDPLADGPVIQRSSERALARGVHLDHVLELARCIRAQSSIGLLLFGYYNPFLRMGLERFAAAAAVAGVDGVLVTDLVPEEAAAYRAALGSQGLDTVFLAAPTSPDARLQAIAQASSGFIYAVSRTGVTGARNQVPAGARELVSRLRRHTALPIALGFGLSTAQQVAEVAGFADGVVVGTALVDAIDRGAQTGGDAGAVHAAGAFLRGLNGTPSRT